MKSRRKEGFDFTHHPYLMLTLYSVLLTAISYIAINTNSQIYDYPFHMARIVGLAHSIANQDFLPSLNFLFAYGAGYGVPMFYGNAILYLPALVYVSTKIGTLAYASYAFIIVCATSLTSYYSLYQITQDKTRAVLFGMTMATVFPLFGYGMSAASPFIPFLIYCIYKVLYMDRLNPLPLGITVALLVQTHVISTLVLAISSALFVLFSIHKLTFKKMSSFVLSILLSVGLSIGYILQYLEQNNSQTFFVSWGLRDYPFPTAGILSEVPLSQIVETYLFPLALVFMVVGILLFKYLQPVARVLVVTSLVLFLATSNLLPWQAVLRFTALAVLQYSTRLIYFLPAFVIMALFLTKIKYVAPIVAVLQIGFYLYTNPLSFLPNTANFSHMFPQLSKANIDVMREQNKKATETFTDPVSSTYWTSGNEYFNLSVDHKHVEEKFINRFEYDNTKVRIENIREGYNKLEFDVVLEEGQDDVAIVLPRIWYKGYQAQYADGARGTQPEIAYVDLTEEELEQYRNAHKPDVTTKALYDGRAVIKVNKAGHITISHQKTTVQLLGFTLETLAWIVAVVVLIRLNRKKNEPILD